MDVEEAEPVSVAVVKVGLRVDKSWDLDAPIRYENRQKHVNRELIQGRGTLPASLPATAKPWRSPCLSIIRLLFL